MKPRLTPTQILLKDLAPEGQEFVYNRETGELTPILADLIGPKNPYDVRLKLTPMGNAYELRGDIRTTLDLQCSECGGDFKYKVSQPVYELIVPQKTLGKGDSQARTNHAHEMTENGPNYILLETEIFNIGEYVHEAVALAEPIRPVGKPDCDPQCGEEKIERPWLTYGDKSEKPGDGIRANPFAVLEKMKLKG
jgi:uncharacterized protein